MLQRSVRLFERARVFEFEFIFSWRTFPETSTFWFSFSWESCSGEERGRGFWRISIKKREKMPRIVRMNA